MLIALLLKKSIAFSFACTVFLLLAYLGSITAVVTVANDEFRAIWFIFITFFGFLLRGVNFGYFFAVLSVIALVAIQLLAQETYSNLSFSTILITLLFFNVILSLYTQQMERYRLQLQKQSKELHYLANKDPLTDMLNSDTNCSHGKKLVEQAKHQQSELSMFCVFIDNLDAIYLKHGFKIENSLLAHVETLIDAQLSQKGEIVKVSQKEICVFLPEYDALSAKSLAHHISDSVQEHLFSAGNNKIVVTLSIGIATLIESDNEIRSMQIRADKALTKAKELGGNSVISL